MTEYVLGFVFDAQEQNVALIQKKHPEWQKGKFNGLGGKIEFGEYPLQAMIREFKEESGVFIEANFWTNFAKIEGKDYRVWCYKVSDELVFGIKTQTDEKVGLFPVYEVLGAKALIYNLNWLIPLALDKEQKFTIINY